MKLISMTDFVFMLRNRTTSELCKDFPNVFRLPEWNGNQDDMVKKMLAIDAIQWKLTGEYAKFLKRPLKLEMFVPCDENGIVIERPIDIYYKPDFGCQKYPQESYEEDLRKYEKAKEKVLFEGFEFKEETENLFYLLEDGVYIYTLNKKRNRTIEDSIAVYNLKLTESAIKQIGL